MIKYFTATLITLFAAVNIFGANANDILKKQEQRYDVTFTNPNDNNLVLQKIIVEVPKIAQEVNKITSLMPRVYKTGYCGDTGCNIDSVKCNAIYEDPICPPGSTLNKNIDMCQKDPNVKECPTGFTYDNILDKCIKSVECPGGGTYIVSRQRCEYKRIYECPAGYTEDSNGICIAPPTCPSGATFDKNRNRCEIPITITCPDGWSLNTNTVKCEKNPNCSNGTYDRILNKCVARVTIVCAAGYTLNTTSNRCESNPVCPSGTTYNSITNRCEGGSACSVGTYDAKMKKCIVKNIQIAVGRIGDNYLNGYCKLYTFVSKLRIDNIKKISSFRLKKTYFDDYIKVEVNGHVVRVGPFGGDRLILKVYNTNVFWLSITKVQYNASSYGNCELGTSWRQNHNIDVKPYLKNGENIFKITVEVTGGGEGYAYFESAGSANITCISGYCSKSYSGSNSYYTTTCPAGYSVDSSGKCYINPTCPNGGLFDGRLDKCYKPITKNCPIGYTYSSTNDVCIKNPDCSTGSLDATTDKCVDKVGYSCPQGGTRDVFNKVCAFTATCSQNGSLTGSNCSADKIPLQCPTNNNSGTDTTLDVCYSHINDCLISSSYPNRNSLYYSNSLKSCIVNTYLKCQQGMTWSAIRQKCEAVPICSQGIYNPENNGCFNEEYSCPLGASYPCIGPSGNKWCSPWKCSSDNKCGYAYCANNNPNGGEPWMELTLLPDIQRISNGQCTSPKCDLAINRDISYCDGVGDACPKGFGVYSKNGKCYKDICPEGSQLGDDGKCYTQKCPVGTIDQGDGTCK